MPFKAEVRRIMRCLLAPCVKSEEVGTMKGIGNRRRLLWPFFASRDWLRRKPGVTASQVLIGAFQTSRARLLWSGSTCADGGLPELINPRAEEWAKIKLIVEDVAFSRPVDTATKS